MKTSAIAALTCGSLAAALLVGGLWLWGSGEAARSPNEHQAAGLEGDAHNVSSSAARVVGQGAPDEPRQAASEAISDVGVDSEERFTFLGSRFDSLDLSSMSQRELEVLCGGIAQYFGDIVESLIESGDLRVEQSIGTAEALEAYAIDPESLYISIVVLPNGERSFGRGTNARLVFAAPGKYPDLERLREMNLEVIQSPVYRRGMLESATSLRRARGGDLGGTLAEDWSTDGTGVSLFAPSGERVGRAFTFVVGVP